MRPITILGTTAAIVVLAGCSTSKSAAGGSGGRTSGTAAGSVATGVDSGGLALSPDTIVARADRGRTMGDTTTTIWLVMASDFQCPWCKRWHDSTFAPVMQNYVRTGKVRMAYLNYPMQMHPNAVPAAEAAMCGSAQGKFWEMHDALFAEQDKWAGESDPAAKLDALAARAGVAMPAWRQCMKGHATLALIEADRERAAKVGVRSTPTFFIGPHPVPGYLAYPEFQKHIDTGIAQARRAATKSPGT